MKSGMKAALIVLAAGAGSRFGHSTNKVWLPLSGRRIISRSLVNAANSFNKARIILVIHPDDDAMARTTLEREVRGIKVEIVHGGASRHESEYNALTYIAPQIESGEIEVVLIHDGARPLATPALFREIADAAHRHGGAIPTIAVDPREMDTVREDRVVRVQTPQGFLAPQLLLAYRKAVVDGFTGTDTAACMEKYFPEVKTKAVNADVSNVKITYPQDLAIAEHVLARRGYKD
jgi:2-C-methyl-D-erythritol 4-phosphate cytidylyltransferase|uniref:IspD/TarI family cytidylyltransferase n=1 Tax=Candidatus Planktophila sp. TaxID=2175601 RepID=UPI004049743F